MHEDSLVGVDGRIEAAIIGIQIESLFAGGTPVDGLSQHLLVLVEVPDLLALASLTTWEQQSAS